MSFQNSLSALIRALALYCNGCGQVLRSKCLVRDLIACSDCSSCTSKGMVSLRFRLWLLSMFRFSFPLVSLIGLVRSSPTARFSLNESPSSESNVSISIWTSSSLEVVGTARCPSSVRRLMAVFFQARHGFDTSGSRQLPIKESDGDQCSVSLRQMACCCSFYTQTADRKFCILICWFVTCEK